MIAGLNVTSIHAASQLEEIIRMPIVTVIADVESFDLDGWAGGAESEAFAPNNSHFVISAPICPSSSVVPISGQLVAQTVAAANLCPSAGHPLSPSDGAAPGHGYGHGHGHGGELAAHEVVHGLAGPACHGNVRG